MDHIALGRWGEDLAVAYLKERGYVIRDRNWRYQKSELDIICQWGNSILVVVEVKTRNSDFFGDPQSFVNGQKIKHTVKATHQYVLLHDLDMEIRFDIIAILKNNHQQQLKHFENAFYHF
ncbi:MAG: YraN family protein [Dokdonia sp.]|jgi:putative endonuclease|nr:endonuclease [Cytophagaceae bacterium]|tara:strand:- start:85 stop:444 length:360 start_codon:yes stop_codon:yes gene_type:complete